MDSKTELKQLTNKSLLNELEEGHLISDLTSNDLNTVFLHNPNKGTTKVLNLKKLKQVYKYKDFEERFPLNFVTFQYRPDLQSGVVKDYLTQDLIFNSYSYPVWRLENPPEFIELPEVHQDFFKHLFVDEESLNYVLDWLACSLNAKQYLPFLFLAGRKGIGKGILSDIIAELHGLNNRSVVSQKMFNSNFNSQIKNKTFIFFDEIKLTTDDQLNKLKLLINDYIETEGKYTVSESVRNYAKILIATNNLDAIQMTQDERRFSIPDLTNLDLAKNQILMDKYGSTGNLKERLLEHDNIVMFGNYLLERQTQITRDMVKFFKTDSFIKMFVTSLKDWEDNLFQHLNDLYSKTDRRFINITEIQNIIKSYCEDESKPPGRQKLSEFCDKFSNYFKWKIDNGQLGILLLERNKKKLETKPINKLKEHYKKERSDD